MSYSAPNTPFIWFAHANGFVASSYRFLFNLLSPCVVGGVERIAHHTAYASNKHWQHSVVELIDALSVEVTVRGKAIGVGHSLGGVLLLFAAQKRPDLFQKIIILDPPLFRPARRALLGVLDIMQLHRFFAPAKKAYRRRNFFESRQAAYTYFSQKAFFRRFHPNCFDDYVEYGLEPDESGSGFRLTFSPQIEYTLFCNTPYRVNPTPLAVPSCLIHATQQSVLSLSDLEWLKKGYAFDEVLPFNGTHLFPFEQPHQTAKCLLGNIFGHIPA